MSSNLKRRLDKVEIQIAALPRLFTVEENREWAEGRLEEVMRECGLSRDEAIKCAKEYAPTLTGFLGE